MFQIGYDVLFSIKLAYDILRSKLVILIRKIWNCRKEFARKESGLAAHSIATTVSSNDR